MLHREYNWLFIRNLIEFLMKSKKKTKKKLNKCLKFDKLLT